MTVTAVREIDIVPPISDGTRSHENGGIPNDDVDQYHLFEDSNRSNCPTTHFARPLIATKLAGNLLTLPHRLDLNPPQQDLISGSGLWTPPLKAIPLSSYYKLHRVPSLATMTEPTTPDSMPAIKLPRRESTTEAPERPQNGVQSKTIDQNLRTAGREPSPQPTHLSVSMPGSHRILQEGGSGYIAPRFEGKDLQMEQGMFHLDASAASIATH